MVSHAYGISANLDKIIALCKKYNLQLIDHAAETLGFRYKGKHTGIFGKFGFFSRSLKLR